MVTQLAVVLPCMLLVVVAGIGAFALSANLGVGIGVLLVLFLVTWIPVNAAAKALDYRLDGGTTPIRLEADYLALPAPNGGERRLLRAGMTATPGWCCSGAA